MGVVESNLETRVGAVAQRFVGVGTVSRVTPVLTGLINDTYFVEGDIASVVVQRLSPIFDPAIHRNIEAVTLRLVDKGLGTPRLLPTREGRLYEELDGEVWRCMSREPGESYTRPADSNMATSAGRLVGRFHRALDGLDHVFVARRKGVHDTPRHLEKLREAVDTLTEHLLHGEVSVLAKELFAAAERLEPLPRVGRRVCHGDLKFNNLLFVDGQASCLIDLDTVGPMALHYELGDAFRSWCNAGLDEKTGEARFDVELFEAAWEGYLAGMGQIPTEAECRGVVWGVDWIALELAVRFAADALLETYFGWDRDAFETRGDHNLARAREQFALHKAAERTREHRAAIVDVVL